MTAPQPGPQLVGKRLTLVLLVAAAAAMVMGGEYSTFDWFELRRQEREERARVAELEQVVDSLQKLSKALLTDRRMQERVARESFGMIGKGEHLYRLLPPEGNRR